MAQVIKHKLRNVDVDAVKPHPKNRRQGDVGAISESIEINDFADVVKIQESKMRIIGGEHTWRAAKSLGLKRLPMMLIDCDDDRAERLMRAYNRTADLASYDEQGLIDDMKKMLERTGTLAGTGFDTDALDELIGDLERAGQNLDGGAQMGDMEYRVLIECRSEQQQADLLARFEKEGLTCQALMS